MAVQTTLEGGVAKVKPTIPAHHVISWYYGNFLMSPGNALRDIDEEKYLDETHKLIDQLTVEFKDQKMTHKQFLDLMKERGIHAQYYRYQKPMPTTRLVCRFAAFIEVHDSRFLLRPFL